MAKSTEVTLEEVASRTKKNFEVQKDKKYLITELPNGSTPEALRALGRVKLGGDFKEDIGAPWDDNAKRYDTGLNKYSREFFGKSDTEINKILKERKVLVDYLNSLVAQSGLTETQFLAGHSTDDEKRKPYKLTVFHGKVVNTENMDEYLKLFLACRGKLLMPSTEKGNIGTYGSAMYQVGGVDDIQENKESTALKEAEVISWIYSNYDNQTEKVLNTLIYAEAIPVGQTKSLAILLQSVQLLSKSFDSLNKMYRAIKEVDYSEIKINVAIRKAIKKGVLKRSKKGITYDEQILGYTVEEVSRNIQLPDNLDIAEKVLSVK